MLTIFAISLTVVISLAALALPFWAMRQPVVRLHRVTINF